MTSPKLAHCWIICKKIFSVTLLFNALLSIGCATGILAGFYWRYTNWQPFAPFLISATVFWVLITGAIINIFPSAGLGRSLHTGRFLFHHYFYGFLVLACAAIYIVAFTPVSIFNIFFINSTSIDVNIGRFFMLGGTTLVLDDLPDVHGKIESSLNWLKAKVGQGGKIVTALQLACGAVTSYLFLAIALAMIYDFSYFTLANMIVLISTLITSITSFVFVKRKIWLKINRKRF